MRVKELKTFCRLDTPATNLLEQLVNRFGLSTRGCTLILKKAKAIADLDTGNNIQSNHIADLCNIGGWV